MFKFRIALSLLLVIITAGTIQAAGKKEDKNLPGTEKPVVAVSILPQAFFAGRISGERVDTLVLVGNGQSPHSYEPTPRQMSELASAKAWILSNTDFEITLKPKIASIYPSLLIVDGTEGVKFRAMEEHEHEGEDAEQHDDDHDINIDRHTWLGREPAKIMAMHIKNTLIKIDPAGKTVFEANYNKLMADIDLAFDSLKTVLAPLKGQAVFVFHPAFGYFLDEFGIIQEAVETGGKEPTAKALSELIRKINEEKASVIFVQAQFPVNAAKTVASSAGAQVVPLDPLAEDWLANIKTMGSALEKAAGAAGKK